jgi:pantoate--beta-alanine ligase
MRTVETLKELWQVRKEMPGTVGLVPTMGFLHEGHLMLVKKAKESCASVVVSIFVNPTQFGPSEDLEAYPRDLERDLALLKAQDVDLVWIPTPETLYPSNYQTWVEVSEVTQPLEGGFRPGHFRGVATVVAKLFNAVRPDVAVFGQKDAQQAAVIRQMTRDLSYPIEIKIVPTVREDDGLALSSRNTYLNTEQRKAATVLYRALRTAEKAYLDGERNASTIRQMISRVIETEPLANIQYVSCADLATLAELETISHGALLSMAVYVGKTRLIDNWILGNQQAG